MKEKRLKAKRRAARVRARVRGTAERVRLTIKRSSLHIYAQLINDDTGKTLASASDIKFKKEGLPMERAAKVGTVLAENGIKAGVKLIVVDRGSYKYHGRVKALVEAALANGLSNTK